MQAFLLSLSLSPVFVSRVELSIRLTYQVVLVCQEVAPPPFFKTEEINMKDEQGVAGVWEVCFFWKGVWKYSYRGGGSRLAGAGVAVPPRPPISYAIILTPYASVIL